MSLVEKILRVLPNASYHPHYNLVVASLDVPEDVLKEAARRVREKYSLSDEDVELLVRASEGQKLIVYVDLSRRRVECELLRKQDSILRSLKLLSPDKADQLSEYVGIYVAYTFDHAKAHYDDLLRKAWDIVLEQD